MIRGKRLAVFTALSFFLVAGITGCRDMLHDINAISADLPQIKSVSMIDIQDVNNGGTSGLVPFRINTYETTYLLWHEVELWGKENGYNFLKPADVGDKGDLSEAGVYSFLPVTACHPADIFVWCNAISEKNGLTPVYYKDKDFKEVLKNGADIAKEVYVTENSNHYDMNGNLFKKYDFTLEKTFYQKKDASGYRIPTVAEWQYAAQGARRTAADRSYKYAGSNDYKEVAAYTTLKIPGSLKPNGIGTYDMSGNVCEYAVAEAADNTVKDNTIYCYGGHYLKGTAEILSVQRLYDLKGIIHLYSNLFGFRLAQTIIE